MLQLKIRTVAVMTTFALAMAACSSEPDFPKLKSFDDIVAFEKKVLNGLYHEEAGYDFLVAAQRHVLPSDEDPAEFLPEEEEWEEGFADIIDERGTFKDIEFSRYERDFDNQELQIEGTLHFENEDLPYKGVFVKGEDGVWVMKTD
ncbi:hypothetical protein [Aquisalimonas asiatica]|uniref:DUF4878 domain-containing protein n=1 Tax=Aquisalimonas asiatica TaxID=406100 RepID=A0A1H8VD03_9GAMM|nr:hypothetical protein [Aquisalimonas asiatica]SEP12748.1 hypothetical protein SAMN04488052_11133 [Aquisalimonas asiatica]